MRRIIAFILCAIMCLALISSAYAADDPIVIGTTITLGEYEQDNNLGNGTEPIQWIVLDIQDSKALILSKYLIDTIMYNNKATYITWENCSLRNWLNDDFLSTAFDGEAQNSILLTNVKNDMGQGLDDLSVDGGNDTEDHIFLLSFQEVLQYFKTDTLICNDRCQEAISPDSGFCGIYPLKASRKSHGIRSPALASLIYVDSENGMHTPYQQANGPP